ncbi:MAG: ACT domain-containing protein [Promethearchaeota archaeon]
MIRISKAVITCVGMDKPGIIASISKILGDNDINIVDIAQSFAHDFFTMIWIIDLEQAKISLRELKEKLKSLGDKMDLIIELYHEDIFKAMHRI